jgi:hypothetical protein
MEAILSDSAASMRGGAPLDSREARAAWWQARLALDGRAAGLLRRVGGGWLGPWRCLLAAGAPPGGRRAAELREAAEGFVTEHFDFVDGESSSFPRLRTKPCMH